MKRIEVPEWNHQFIFNHPTGDIVVHIKINNQAKFSVRTEPARSWTRIPTMLQSAQFTEKVEEAFEVYREFLRVNGLNPKDL